jgi:hypothetical protein
MFADGSIILRRVGLDELSDGWFVLCSPLTYVPQISDIIIEFHHKIEETYFKRRTYRRCRLHKGGQPAGRDPEMGVAWCNKKNWKKPPIPPI